jgi:biotin operon repressor
VIEEVVQFISRVAPHYDIAAKLVFVPDYARLLDELSRIIKVTSDGEVLLQQSGLPADKAILLTLAGAKVAKRFGKREREDLSAEEIARAVGKTSKTIRNNIAALQNAGMVERVSRGSYRITEQGMMQIQSTPVPSLKQVDAMSEV